MSEKNRLELEQECLLKYSKAQMINKYIDELEENEKLHKELDYADNYNIYLIAKLDKIKEYIENTDDFDIEIFDENSGGCLGTDLSKGAKHILELLEEIE